MSEKEEKVIKELGFGQYLDAISTGRVQSRVKNKSNQPQTIDVPQGRDLFQTPNYAVDILIPFIPKHIKWIWEPACGDGKIVKALYKSKDRPLVCYQSDIRQSAVIPHNIGNFLTGEEPMLFSVEDWAIITNPPFSLKQKFYDRCLEYKVPFALLIPADYSGWIINAVRLDGAEKIIPTRRIDFITPNIVNRINDGEGLIDNMRFADISEIPQDLLHKYSSSDFHSMWLTWGFNLGRTETFVELTNKEKKENI